MAVITIPAKLYFTDVDIWNDRVSAVLRSPFTGKRQVRKRAYDLWNFTGNLMPLDPMEAGDIKAFLMELAGQVNSFRLPVPGSKFPLSNYTGVQGMVNGNSQTGRSVATVGWSPNKALLKRGDHFNIADELKVCTANVASAGDGSALISFEPPIRTSPLSGNAIKVREPFILLASNDDGAARWKITPPIRHGFKMNATETF